MEKKVYKKLEQFLMPTKLIQSDHPKIVSKTRELTGAYKSEIEKVRAIFNFIRDRILYDFQVKLYEEEYTASSILKEGKGFCTQKAILFCALARCAGIPAGIQFYDIVDHTLPDRIFSLLQTRKLVRHGIGALYLKDVWRRYDATLERELVQRKELVLVEFSPDKDCLMSEFTLRKTKHIEYIKDFGLSADVSYSEIMNWFIQGYPHLVNIIMENSDYLKEG